MSVEDNRKLWVESLRSGDYKQGVEYLYNPNNNTYCCLGVLCKVYEDTTGDTLPRRESGGFKAYEQHLEDFPKVREWVGLASYEGEINDIGTALTTLNDSGNCTFNDLADIIEEEPDGLFL